MPTAFDPYTTLKGLSQEQLRQLEIDALREAATKSLHYFIRYGWKYMDPAEFVDNWHIGAICLPPATSVITEVGQKSIGEIVDTGWNGRVLSHCHDTDALEWKPIVARMKSSSQPLMVVAFEGGTSLKISGNHPIFVKGKGYVRADEVSAGDIVLRAMQGREATAQRGPVVQKVLLGGQGERCQTPERAPVQSLWRSLCALSGAYRTVLQHEMFWRCQGKARDGDLPQVWRQKGMGWGWLSALLCQGQDRSAAYAMLPLWSFGSALPIRHEGQFETVWGLLQSSLFWRVCPGAEEPSVYRRRNASRVPSAIPASAAQGVGARVPQMLSMFKSWEAGRSPYRPEQKEQRIMEPRCSVPDVSQPPEGHAGTGYRIVEDVVRSVEREIWKHALYNLEVADNNNYFAENVLVHNCEHLEAVTRGEIRRLIINQPPRTQKSLTTAVAWPAWAWAQGETSPLAGPSTSYMFASYAQTLSVRDSVKCRRLIESPWYQKQWGGKFTLTSDQNTKMRFDNSAGGYRIATSVGGYLTGEGASVICVDDPHNTVEAESELVSQGVLDWWDEAMSTRLNDPKTGAYVLVMQRLQENDLCGHILERDSGWTHLMLPMRFDDRRVCVTVLGSQDPREEDGELLWPERFGEPEVDELETRLGPYAAAGQLQQSPTPRGGGIIKREWWRAWPPVGEEERWTKTATVYGLDGVAQEVERITYPDFEFIMVSVDTAYTEDEENDYSAVTVWGIFKYRSVPKIMLIHAWRDRLELHPLVARLLDTCKKRGADMVLVEGKASGISVAQEIKRLMRPGAFTVKVMDPKRQDKTARLTAVQPMFAGGMIYAPETVWAEMVITEVSQAPKAKYDDLCLTGDTLIATATGQRPISEIRAGEMVMTPLGFRRVLMAGLTGVAPVIRKCGLELTPNHPIFTFDSGFIPADTIYQDHQTARLTLCDLIRYHRQKVLSSTAFATDAWAESKNTTSPKPQRPKTGAAQKGFTLPSGNFIPARAFRSVMRLTTLMETPLIAALRIWSAYRLTSTAAYLSGATRKNLNRVWQRLGLPLLRGIAHQRVANGIGRFLPNPLNALAMNGPANVSFVERISPRNMQAPSFVATTAGSRPATEGVALVYNLTVDEAHCFYANGVLVHNCDTTSQALLYLRRAGIAMLEPEVKEERQRAMQYKPEYQAPYDV